MCLHYMKISAIRNLLTKRMQNGCDMYEYIFRRCIDGFDFKNAQVHNSHLYEQAKKCIDTGVNDEFFREVNPGLVGCFYGAPVVYCLLSAVHHTE